MRAIEIFLTAVPGAAALEYGVTVCSERDGDSSRNGDETMKARIPGRRSNRLGS
ncbi:MAG: hypothetical protein ACE5HV_14830 [Acidobacteriota bacterium]